MANFSNVADVPILENPNMSGTDGFIPPSGTTAQRPSGPATGLTRYNTTDNMLEYFNGTIWTQL